MILNNYNDPGHGWLKVKISLLRKLEIADKITNYSYMRNNYAYLEEDQDVSLFIATMEKNNIPYSIKGFNTNNRSKIRSYSRYEFLTIEQETYYNNKKDVLKGIFNSKKSISMINKADRYDLDFWLRKYNLT